MPSPDARFRSCLDLVPRVSHRWRRYNTPTCTREDLDAAALVALWQASRRPNDGRPFRRYAASAMSLAICMAIRTDQRHRRPEISLDAPGYAAADTPAEPEPNAEARCCDRETATELGAAVYALPERERHVIRCRYLVEPKMTLDAVAAGLGISRQQVVTAERKGLARLRGALAQLKP